MKNIHVLPTEKPSIICKLDNVLVLSKIGILTNDTKSLIRQNIYITSDEKFKQDEYITDGIEVIKASPKLVNAQGLVDRRDWKKIILTTDQDLIKDGVQKIDDEFLELFVKNPSCESVKVKKITYPSTKGFLEGKPLIIKNIYEIIIPKEEPKQETIDEAASRLLYSKYPFHPPQDSGYWKDMFLEGAKWRQEQICNHNYILTDEQGHRVIKCDKCNHTQPI